MTFLIRQNTILPNTQKHTHTHNQGWIQKVSLGEANRGSCGRGAMGAEVERVKSSAVSKRIEAAKAPRRIGCGYGCPLPTGGGV